MSWSGTNAFLFASGSDDTNVKLWSVKHVEATIIAQKSSANSRKRKNAANNNDLEEQKGGGGAMKNTNIRLRSKDRSKSCSGDDSDEDVVSNGSDD